MIGNFARSNRLILSKIFTQTERKISCQVCTVNVIDKKNDGFYSNSPRKLLPSSLHQIDLRRHYSIGDYDKLWQAVSSGRGKGRSVKKKVTPKNIVGEFLKFGTTGTIYPGLNAPILPVQDPREKKDERPERQRRKMQRGWTGTSWPGRYAGAPESLNGEVVKGFESIVLEVKRVACTTKGGRNRQIFSIVAVGNKNGSIGWAVGKAQSATKAIKKARNKAVNYLHYIPICDGHTIYHDLGTKVKSTEIKFERKVCGYGRRCQRIVRAICELAGIEDIRCKIVGRTTPLTVVRCTFQGLKMQETHQELAQRLGKNVVEYRTEQGNRPVIVASPSPEAVKQRIKSEKQLNEDDITVAFDPHQGAHRPKTLFEIKGDYSEILIDADEDS